MMFAPAPVSPAQPLVGCWFHHFTPSVQNPFSRSQVESSSTKLYPVPLKAVEVKGRVLDLIAEVEVAHYYENKEKDPIEATYDHRFPLSLLLSPSTPFCSYTFPVDAKAAICGFEAFIDGKKVVGKVQEKEEAQNTYDDAISEGHGAYLLEQQTDNVFTANIGNLPPGKGT